MKFLGLRIEDHDSNITYTDGTKVRYCATERLFGIKHHGYDNTWQWQDVLDSWGVNADELDALAIISDQITFEDGETYRELDMGFPCRTFAVDHHYCHALSLWPLGEVPYTNYIYDGFGNNDRSYSLILGNKIGCSHSVLTTGSIGVEMAKVGRALGIEADPHGLDLAGKIMGLAAYGLVDEEYYHKISHSHLTDIKKIWNYDSWDRKWDNDFDINWLRTVHEYTGDQLALYMNHPVGGDDVIGYSGGIAQNCVFNGKILSGDKKIMIPPHANDCGLTLGAVEFLRQHYHEEPFSNEGFPFWQDDEGTEEVSDQVILETAEALADGDIVAWYQGHGEIGPRALGNRSILMNPRLPDAKDTLNRKVKHREHFRPFGGSVLLEDVDKHFEWTGACPYMNVSVPVKDDGLKAITHIDGSSRIQTVDGDGSYARLLRKYKEITGDGVLLNTSLNVGGKPIAGHKWEAKEMFSKRGIDVLVIGDDILSK
tara:strand:- start:47 stop:1498 length:1452 start_codon:yes stop_codon:yes gene_type:complete